MHFSPKVDYCWKCGTHKKEKSKQGKEEGGTKHHDLPQAQKYTPNQQTFELGHLTFENIRKQSKEK
jgi:hypothetical protein